MVCRWAQELLGYQFTVVHRPNKMMVDIDAVTHRYGPLITMHFMVSTIFHHRDLQHKPLAYEHSLFFASKTAKLMPNTCTPGPTPILCNSFIAQRCHDYSRDVVTTNVPIISSSPVLYTTFSRFIHNFTLPFKPINENRTSASPASIFSD